MRKCWRLAFSPFPTVFSTLSKRETIILATFNFSSTNALFVYVQNSVEQELNKYKLLSAKVFFYFMIKHCWKKRNWSLQAISSFPSVFSTNLDNFLLFSSSLNYRQQTHSVWRSLKFVVWDRLKSIFSFISTMFQKPSLSGL